jgi:hypothetical protein
MLTSYPQLKMMLLTCSMLFSLGQNNSIPVKVPVKVPKMKKGYQFGSLNLLI